jgi:fructoselysine-6-P-deglycase FrlB-like protein
MSFVGDEIASQPETWARAAAMTDDPAVREAMPSRGERVAIVGCGTSLYMAQACAVLRETSGAGQSDAFPASEYPVGRAYDRVIALTRSGTTTEVIRLLGQLPARQRSTVITTDAQLPAARQASESVILAFADEQSVVQTRFATSVLALWRAWLGVDLGPTLDDVAAELTRPLPAELLGREQFTFLGTGWTVGLANEAALKLREAAQMWAESYPAMEFRHGPISVVDARSAVWIFGAIPNGLRDDIAGTGAAVVHSAIDPMAHLTTAQRLAVALAEGKGLDPDNPRGLTRSIVLTV